MIVVQMDTATLANTRFAASPVAETVAWLRLAAAGRHHPVYGDPGPAARFSLRDPDVAMVAAVMPPAGIGYTPDFLTPKPLPAQGFDDQLGMVAATPAPEVAAQLTGLAFPGRPLPAVVADAVHAGTFGSRSANGLRRFHAATIADGWSTIGTCLNSDIAGKAQLIATAGLAAVLSTLHRGVRFASGQLLVDKPYTESHEYRDAELVLTPSALDWPNLTVQLCDPDQATVCYPASGIGIGGPDDTAVLSRLVGGTRARLLRVLASPLSTTELAGRFGLTPATVSYHLRILYQAGLVVRRREGHSVRYRRSGHGEALLDASDLAAP